jgi:sugar phosphate permease
MGTLLLLTNWFDLRRFATLSGLVLSLGYLGSLSATSPLALLVQALGWRGSFCVLAGFNALVTIGLLLFVRDRPPHSQIPTPDAMETASFSVLTSIKTLFSSWNYWAISSSIFLRYGSFAPIHALWSGPFLIEYLGLTAVSAGNLLLMINIGTILGSAAAGLLSDRILKSRKRTLIVGLSAAAMATFALAKWEGTSLLFLLGGILLAIGFFNSFSIISYAHIRELMPKEMSGTAMTGINFFTMLGGGLFIHALGGIMERMAPDLSGGGAAYETAFLICVGALVMSLILYCTTRDTTPAIPSPFP